VKVLVQVHSVIHELSISHNFLGCRCTILTFTLWSWKPFSNSHWHGKYVCQVSLKSVHKVQRYRVTRNTC